MKISKYILYFFCTIHCMVVHGYNAVVHVPVADALGDFFKQTHKILDAQTGYRNLPLCGQKIADCPRVHQLLMNECIEVLKVIGDQCLIRVPSVFYELEGNKEKCNTFWTLKKNVSMFEELAHAKIDKRYFPDPISYHVQQNNSKKVVTLLKPFCEPLTKQLLSVGTRFVVHALQPQAYIVYFFNVRKKTIDTIVLPKALCRLENSHESFEKKMELCIQLMRSWITSPKIIPYVWGGCSFTTYCSDAPIERKETLFGSCYERAACAKQIPKIGFDCTGLLLRVAQIYGLPYYFKNSTTILKNLAELSENEKIAQGDLIWIPGHIMIVADLVKNTVIEARGYNHGFGKVQEISLAKLFKNVKDFNQLKMLFHADKPLQRLDKSGAEAHSIAHFKLLSMKSILGKKL